MEGKFVKILGIFGLVIGAMGTIITDMNGRPVPSLTSSLTVGKAGPMLLQDVNFISHLAHFDRERIPERVVHAKGAGAHGEFTATHDISKYTKAKVFVKGQKTKVFTRFSTVVGESGSSDIDTSPRGFAVKFYTQDGNLDIAGNNIVIFAIRDAIFFPSFIHSQKRNPTTHLSDPNAQWDFFGLRAETTHFIFQVFSDWGNPDGYRYMDGGGVHTFKLVNAENKAVYCKFIWKSNQGLRNLTIERSMELKGSDPDYATRDLFEAIAKGDFPSWKLFIQVMTFEQAASSKFNPFDDTKIWPESDYPLIPAGEMVLNKNPVDYFSEVELSAFDPGSLVPGIEMSPDRMLIGRSFSYLDTHRYRLGANYLSLPINHPLNKVHTFQRDGAMALENGDGAPNYFPNNQMMEEISKEAPESVFPLTGDVDRQDSGDEDNFSQPKEFLMTLNSEARERLKKRLCMGISGAQPEIRKRVLENFAKADDVFSKEVEKAIECECF